MTTAFTALASFLLQCCLVHISLASLARILCNLFHIPSQNVISPIFCYFYFTLRLHPWLCWRAPRPQTARNSFKRVRTTDAWPGAPQTKIMATPLASCHKVQLLTNPNCLLHRTHALYISDNHVHIAHYCIVNQLDKTRRWLHAQLTTLSKQ